MGKQLETLVQLWYKLGTKLFAHTSGTRLVRAGVVAVESCERQTGGSIHSIGKHVDGEFRSHGKNLGSIRLNLVEPDA